MSSFEGSMVAIVTPFDRGQIDEPALRRLIDFQIENGTQVIVPCGTTGESATLSQQEKERVITLVIEHVAGRAKVLAGAGSNDTAQAVKMQNFCYKAGADGTLQITPYYNKPTQKGLEQHFLKIAATNDLPIVLYNVPGRTGVNLSVETAIQLSFCDTIVGIKEASGNLEQAHRIIQNTPDDFFLFSGEDPVTYLLYALGAKGAISVTCNLVPALCAKQYVAFQRGDTKLAKDIHDKLYALHKLMFVETNPIPVKAALALMGYIKEEYRLPLVSLTENNRSVLAEELKQQGLTN